jgi:hypothetical protein
VNPFAFGAGGWDDGGTLDFSNAKNLDIRTAVQWVIPNAVHLVGAGHASVSLPAQNTILRANNTTIYSTGGANFLPATESLLATNFGAVSGGLQTITVPHTMCTNGNKPNNGQDIVINSATNQVYHGFAMNILGCSGGSGTSYQIAVPGTGSGATSQIGAACVGGCTAYEGIFLVHMGPLSAGQNFGTTISGMSFDCSWINGVGALINNSVGEHGFINDVNYWDCGMEGFRYSEAATAAFGDGGANGGGVSQFGTTSNFIIQMQHNTCENTTCGTVSSGQNVTQITEPDLVNQSSTANPLGCDTLGFVLDGPVQVTTIKPQNHIGDIGNFTILLSNGADSASTPLTMNQSACGNAYSTSGPTFASTPIGGLIMGVGAHIHDFSMQFFPADIEIGGNAALNAAFPGFSYGGPSGAPAAITTFGTQIDGSNGLVTTGSGGTGFVVDIGPNATGVELFNLSNGNSSPGNTVNDNVTGGQCTDVNLAYYLLGEGTGPGPTVSSSCRIGLAPYIVCAGVGTCGVNTNPAVASDVFLGAVPATQLETLNLGTNYSFDCEGMWLNGHFVPSSANTLYVQSTQAPTYLRVWAEFGLPTNNTYSFMDSGAITTNSVTSVGTFGGNATVESANTQYPFKIHGSLQTAATGIKPQVKLQWTEGACGANCATQTLAATPESYCTITGVYWC